MGSTRQLGTVVGWLGGLGAAAWALIQLGRQPWLAMDWGDLRHWLTTSELEIVLAALARLAGLAIIGWIVLSSVVYLLARLAGIRATRLWWLSIGPIRRAVDTIVAGSLLISTVAPGVAVASAPSSSMPESTTEETTIESVDPAYVPWPAGRRDDNDSGPDRIEQEPVPAGESGGNDDVDAPGSGTAGTVVVEPGDHLWGMAERRILETLGRPPTGAEVAAYWVSVVDVNRDQLRSGDPDLIFPGEEILLPEINRES